MPPNLPNLSKLRLADPVGAPTYFQRLDEDASKKLDRLLPADAMRKLRSTTRGANYETGTLVVLNQTIDSEGEVKDEDYFYVDDAFPEAGAQKWLLAFYRNADGSYVAINEGEPTGEVNAEGIPGVVFENDGVKVDDGSATTRVEGIQFVEMNALFENDFFYETVKAPELSSSVYMDAWMVLNIPDLKLVGKFKGEATRYSTRPWQTGVHEGKMRKFFDMGVKETITNNAGEKFNVNFSYRVLIEHSMYTDMDELDEFIRSYNRLREERYDFDYETPPNSDSEYDSYSSDFDEYDRKLYGTRAARRQQLNKEANESMFELLFDSGSSMHELADDPYKARAVPGEWALLRVIIRPEGVVA
tara:strand:- start:187 stop:1263 length:1077 start_codon:yes stop_codon:yes gene_type:complete